MGRSWGDALSALAQTLQTRQEVLMQRSAGMTTLLEQQCGETRP